MRLPRLFAAFSLVAALLPTATLAQVDKAVVTTPHVRAELVAHAPEGVSPGKTVWLGLQITHQPDWHTYWKNPGDSGLPTTVTWTANGKTCQGPVAATLSRSSSSVTNNKAGVTGSATATCNHGAYTTSGTCN